MDNLIPVNYDTEEPTVSARDLHEALEINKRFSDRKSTRLNSSHASKSRMPSSA